jgi:O-antigen/teichoic acid export membrane protein
MSEAFQVSDEQALAKRVGRGVGALSLGAIVGIAAQLLTVPIALRVWGPLRYGEWVLVSGLVVFIKFTDLGLQTFVVNKLCSSYARGERDEFTRLLHSALKVQLPLVLALLGALLVALRVAPVDAWLKLTTISGVHLGVVIYLLAFELLLGVPMGVIGGIYRASGHLARAAFVGAVQQLGILLAMLALIVLDADFALVALSRVAVSVLVSAFIVWDLQRLHGWLTLAPRRGSWREGLTMVAPGLLFLLVPLADYISNQLPLIAVQRDVGGTAVSLLATHRTLVSVGPMVSALITAPLWPEFTALHATEKPQELKRVFLLLMKINLCVVAAALLVMLPLAYWLYSLWTGGRLHLDAMLLGVLVVRTLLWSIWSAALTLLLSVNRHRAVTIVLVAGSLLAGGLSFALVPVLSVMGAALATLAADLALVSWSVLALAAREAKLSPTELLAPLARTCLAIAAPAFVAFAAWTLVPSTILRLALILPAGALVAATLVWRQLDGYERRLAAGVYQVFLPLRFRPRERHIP